jgi:uncharacterized membrane protein YfcA
LLALSHPLQFVLPLVLALDLTASLILGGVNRRQVVWTEIHWLLPAGVIGACLGALALVKLPQSWILVSLGIFTMFFGFRNIFGAEAEGHLSKVWAVPAGVAGGSAGALFGTGSPPYIIYLTRRIQDKGAMRATFSCLIAIDGAIRMGIFFYLGFLASSKLQTTFLASLLPMAVGLYVGNQVHLDMSRDAMLRVVGALLVLSGGMLFLKVAI